jgi:hypothetical protein
MCLHQERIQDFKLGGGGAHLKKLRRAEGGAKCFGVFRVKNHDFTPPWIRPCTRSNAFWILASNFTSHTCFKKEI